MADFLSEIKECFGTEAADIRTYSPLTLAYIGDGVYEIIKRTVIVEQGQRTTPKLKKKLTELVCANAQSRLIQAVHDHLSDEEKDIYRRGTNAKLNSTPKNASLADYKKATGFEALCGYLFLTGRTRRAMEIIKEAIELSGMEI